MDDSLSQRVEPSHLVGEDKISNGPGPERPGPDRADTAEVCPKCGVKGELTVLGSGHICLCCGFELIT